MLRRDYTRQRLDGGVPRAVPPPDGYRRVLDHPGHLRPPNNPWYTGPQSANSRPYLPGYLELFTGPTQNCTERHQPTDPRRATAGPYTPWFRYRIDRFDQKWPDMTNAQRQRTGPPRAGSNDLQLRNTTVMAKPHGMTNGARQANGVRRASCRWDQVGLSRDYARIDQNCSECTKLYNVVQ